MNERFARLKMQSYKRKLTEKYSFIDPDKLWTASERSDIHDFVTFATNNNSSSITKFSTYDGDKHIYLDKTDIYQRVELTFLRKAHVQFRDSQILTGLSYHDKYFWIECSMNTLLQYYDKIDYVDQDRFVVNRHLTAFIGLLNEEYTFEIISYRTEH